MENKESPYVKEISIENKDVTEVVKDFFNIIGGVGEVKDGFVYNNERWFVDYHPFDHSDDIIIGTEIADKWDKFLLVKQGSNKARIVGWTDKKTLMSVAARDIYRNGRMCYVVVDTNLNSLESFKILRSDVILKSEFSINSQEADNLGHTEMINGLLAGLHSFVKKADIYFKDINQKDEGQIGDLKFKIFTRDIFSDEDMLIPESYFTSHPEIDIYILCKIKGGKYNYLGYVKKDLVAQTRTVQMAGNEDMDNTGEKIRRIFAEQYLNLNEIIKIYELIKKEVVYIEPQKYVPLHMHSEFSVGDGFGKLSYITDNLKAKGFKGAALTDHGTLAGVLEFQKQCLAKDLKPIIGIEAYIKLLPDEKSERYHTTILVKNKIGWDNLLKLHAVSVRDNFYYKPVILMDDLLANCEGLIITSGCMSAPIPRAIKAGKMEEACALAVKMKEKLKDDLYFEIMIHDIEDNQKVMQKLYDLSLKLNVKCIFTTDTHYSNKEDKKYHDAIKAIDRKVKYEGAGYDDDCFYLLQTQDIEFRMNKLSTNWMTQHMDSWLANTNEIYDKCDFKIEPVKELDTLPKIKFDISRKEKLKQLCLEGLTKYTKYSYADPIIKERLDLELDRIISKEYDNYFLIVHAMIKWAKENGIACGPGRGSVGASLAAYALNITECDPIEHDLLFDRFLSVIRRDMPDVDMDFQDDRREEVYDYLKNTYGENHCAKVATYSRFHPKGILKDIGRIFELPFNEVSKISNMVLERSGGDARASFSLADTFTEFKEAKEFQEKYPLPCDIAMKLESHIRHKGIHAAAMVVTENDVASYVPITRIGGEIVTEFEKQLDEDMHLIKFDILGLKTLSEIADAVKSAGVILPKTFEDPKVYETIFKPANTVGIFQLGTVGMQKFSSQLKMESFIDLYNATTIFRPSCLHSGQAQTFANRKMGKEPIIYFHPALEQITKQSKGVILYQEQIMQIMVDVAGLSWATAEFSRKVITKSKGKDAFNKMRQDFINGAEKKSKMSRDEAEKLFDVVSTFGSYGFNKAHAVEYSILSYYQGWLKTYYPQHFFKAKLKYETDEKEIKNYVQDMKKFGLSIEYPDINHSEIGHSIFNGKIYAGLSSVVGLGESAFAKIQAGRPYVSYTDFLKRCKISSNVLKGLIVADAFRQFKINKKQAFEGKIEADTSQTKLFSSPKSNEDFNATELSQMVFEYTTLTPNIDIKNSYDFGNYKFVDIDELPNKLGMEQYFLRGIVTDVQNKDKLLRADLRKHIHHFERHLIILNLNDGTGNIALQISPETYEKYGYLFENIKKKAIIVHGTASKDGKKLYADSLQIVNKEFKTNDIDEIFNKAKLCQAFEGIITSARPAVSKNNKSYYKVILHNGKSGLCFRFNQKLFPGLMVKYSIEKDPFINLEIIERKKS